MDWAARFNYLEAKSEVKSVDLYVMDLIWAMARKNFTDSPMPSELWYKKQTRDNRTAQQIQDDLVQGLLGGG